jgi:hypothetical protein
VRHDTAPRQRIWPSCRSSHCHSRLSVFVSPTTVSLEASTSGRLYRRAFKAADWSDIATRKYSLSGGPPPPMRGVDEVIFQTLVMSPNMRSSAWLASRFSSANGALSSGHARTPPLPRRPGPSITRQAPAVCARSAFHPRCLFGTAATSSAVPVIAVVATTVALSAPVTTEVVPARAYARGQRGAAALVLGSSSVLP